MKPDQVEQILSMMKEFGVAELELEDGDHRLAVRMQGAMAVAASAPVAAAVQPAAPAAAAPPAAAAAPAGEVVESPMVGTFYRASKPGAAPFVKVGDTVSVGATLCIIEAMKLMNEIESDVAGTIAEVLVEDGQPVQFGQPLFRVS
jgi:acetyl-CoA carboxylase biotin carboxyl carrier protein